MTIVETVYLSHEQPRVRLTNEAEILEAVQQGVNRGESLPRPEKGSEAGQGREQGNRPGSCSVRRRRRDCNRRHRRAR
jgi:hypothetical protein